MLPWILNVPDPASSETPRNAARTLRSPRRPPGTEPPSSARETKHLSPPRALGTCAPGRGPWGQTPAACPQPAAAPRPGEAGFLPPSGLGWHVQGCPAVRTAPARSPLSSWAELRKNNTDPCADNAHRTHDDPARNRSPGHAPGGPPRRLAGLRTDPSRPEGSSLLPRLTPSPVASSPPRPQPASGAPSPAATTVSSRGQLCSCITLMAKEVMSLGMTETLPGCWLPGDLAKETVFPWSHRLGPRRKPWPEEASDRRLPRCQEAKGEKTAQSQSPVRRPRI